MAPQSVIKVIEKLIKDFLWNDVENWKKHHWVNLVSICKPLDKEGLGIRRLKPMNRSLLMKWTNYPKAAYGVGIWKSICNVADDFFKYIQIKLGNASKYISVAAAKGDNSLVLSWNLGIARRRLYDVEITELSALLYILIWLGHSSSVFSVK
ncbi:hypothetical protein C5167_024488 [Papaver somniferum]|uniref:Reverse transcriptase zinc-binding domain-containing protein n=1 Tax=Papaver somniferum TaxID=3469 RepID=A0A4Y7JRR0_PAPSO|nr:hypothetical protein C5167_024488 [Papaver somniferum]